MGFPTPWFSSLQLWRLAFVVLLPTGLLPAAESDEPVAVFSQVFNGYTRTRLPDKSFKPETYTFGEGGCWTRPVRDPGMEEMTFLRVAKAVAAPLGRLNYRPALTSAEAELLILVFWGSTEGSRDYDRNNTIDRLSAASSVAIAARSAAAAVDPKSESAATAAATASAAESELDSALWQMDLANRERDRLDYRNARILGYTDALQRASCAPHMSFAQDTMAEIGYNRYYVVLQAYDFKTAVKEKKLKPLWTARISMDESGNNFAQSLDRMLRTGARYFGQDSNGLHREANREGHVDLGPLDVIETLPEK
jgi:hypothetical protein